MGCAGSKAVTEPKPSNEIYQPAPVVKNINSQSEEEEVQGSVSKPEFIRRDSLSVSSVAVTNTNVPASPRPKSPRFSARDKGSTSPRIKQYIDPKPQSPRENSNTTPVGSTPSTTRHEQLPSNGTSISPTLRSNLDEEELKEAEAELNLGYSMRNGGSDGLSSNLDTSPTRRQRQLVGIPRPSNEFIPQLSPEKAAGLQQSFHMMSHEAKVMGVNTGTTAPTHNLPGLSPVRKDIPWKGGPGPMPGIAVSHVPFGAPHGGGAVLTPSHSPVHGRGRGIPVLVPPGGSPIVRPGIIGGSPTAILAPVGRGGPLVHPMPMGRGRPLQVVIPTLGMGPMSGMLMGSVGVMGPARGGRPQPMVRDIFPTDTIVNGNAGKSAEDSSSRSDDKTTHDHDTDDDDDDDFGLEGDEVGVWDLEDVSEEKTDTSDIPSTSPSNSHSASSSSPPKISTKVPTQQAHAGRRGSSGPSLISQGSPKHAPNRSPIGGVSPMHVFSASPGMPPGVAAGMVYRTYAHPPSFGVTQVPYVGSPKEAFTTTCLTTNTLKKRRSKSGKVSDDEVEEEGSSDDVEEVDGDGDVHDWLDTDSGEIIAVDETEEKPRKPSAERGSPDRISSTIVNSSAPHVNTTSNISSHTTVGTPVMNHRGSLVMPVGSPPRHLAPSASLNPSRGVPLMGAGIRPAVVPGHRSGPIQTVIDPNNPTLGTGMGTSSTMMTASTAGGAPVISVPSTPHGAVPVGGQAQVQTAQTVENGLIRDTKVVKKKRAELPQRNLPHPKPKFGDWLNSRTMINNYIILESLGAGSYAEVKLCKEKTSGKLFAMKFINRDIMKRDKLGKQSKLDDIKREIAIMKKLNHPHVLRLYEVMDDPNMNKLFLVLEYMKHGDLLSHQRKKNPQGQLELMNDRDLHCITLQVLLGLAYLHEQKIVHGDIKPQNLLVGDQDIVKIADFGISQSLYGSKQKLADTAGTPAFMSPEMCSGEEYSGQAADIWAVGATIFMLKFGNPPFVAKSAMQIFEKIQNDPLVFPPLPNTNGLERIDPLIENLLIGMLIKDPLKRMTLWDVMMHPWVTKDEKISNFNLGINPAPQITVSKEEVDHVIDPNRFAIIVNVRIQMMKKLHQARRELIEKHRQMQARESAEEDEEKGDEDGDKEEAEADTEDEDENEKGTSSQEDHTSFGEVDFIDTNRSNSNITSKFTTSSRYSVMEDDAGVPPQKFMIPAGNTHLATSVAQKSIKTSKAHFFSPMMSQEETAYRSKMFARKKPDSMSQKAVIDAAEKSYLRMNTGTSSSEENVELSSSEEGVEDEDDEEAVTQSPQLLDELLLTTLSLPPLSKRSSELDYTSPSEDTAQTHALVHKHHHVVTPTVNTSKDDHDIHSFYGENPFLQVTIAVSSLQGRRSTQEDRYVVLPQVFPTEKASDQIAFAGLYDGHGGDQCANLLQQYLHQWLLFEGRPSYSSSSSSLSLHQGLIEKPMEKIHSCCLDLDSFLCEELMTSENLSGSTATFCLLVAHPGATTSKRRSSVSTGTGKSSRSLRLMLGHVGDCRMVYSGPTSQLPTTVQEQDLTHDHRLTLETEKNRIISLGGRVVNNRVNGVMAITRAFGDLEFKGLVGKRSSSICSTYLQQNPFQPDEDKTPALLTASPDISVIDFEMIPASSTSEMPPRGFLILACDGLWDVMSSEEACSIIRERLLLHGNQQLAAKELAQEGIRRYSNDNITVIILQLPPNIVISNKTECII